MARVEVKREGEGVVEDEGEVRVNGIGISLYLRNPKMTSF